jgi:hypothetical protein
MPLPVFLVRNPPGELSDVDRDRARPDRTVVVRLTASAARTTRRALGIVL